MGQRRCAGDHDFKATDLGAGVARLECRRCKTRMVDLEAERDGMSAVTVPGLFRPSRPTIFSVLGEEQRAEERGETVDEQPETDEESPRYVFGGGVRRR